MQTDPSPIQAFRAAQLEPGFDTVANLRTALARANGNLGHNTYITLDPAWSAAEAERQMRRSETPGSLPLLGLPVSLKDCFDLAGFKTSSGSKFYAEHNPPASEDSAIAARIKQAGGIITGKTHLHQITYGITGENRDYGNCLQPADPTRLTGGSSSGAAASIQEGSALAAIGTDTGGSIRLPAAVCGLAGYRSSLGVADWRGGAHLAVSFDTIGWIFRDLRDAPLLAEAVFDLPGADSPDIEAGAITIGVLAGPLVENCDAAVMRSFAIWQERLLQAGARCEALHPEFWAGAWDIYALIQAWEAAKLHTGFFNEFEPGITARLEWGASLKEEEVQAQRQLLQAFREKMRELFRRVDFVVAPTTPVSSLEAMRDQSGARPHILRLTTPASLAGLPAIALPSPDCGLQLLAAHNDDRRLLRFAAHLGERLAQEN